MLGLTRCEIFWLSLLIKFFLVYAACLTAISFESTPNFEVVKDISAFLGVLFALALPISFEIVSRIAERFSSESVAKLFASHFIVAVLPYWLILAVIFSLASSFAAPWLDVNPMLKKILAWLVLEYLVLLSLMTLFFSYRVHEFATNSEAILKELMESARKQLKQQ